MAQQIRDALLQCAEVLARERGLGQTAVHLERAHRGDDHDRVGLEPGGAALDVQEFLRAEVRAEAGLRHAVLAKLESHARGHDAVAAVGDVREGAAVHEGGRALERLHEVGLERVLQKRGHRADGLEIARGHGLIVIGVADDDAAQPLLEIGDGGGEAEHGHDLAGDGDVEAVLARGAVGLAAESVDHEAQLPVVHIDAALPGDLARVDAEAVALLDVVVEHGGQQVVGRADGVEVAGEVEIDVLHGHYLGVAAARRAALDAEHGAKRGLAQGDNDVLADAAQTVGQADGGRGLALARGRGRDGRDEDQPAIRLVALAQQSRVDLGLPAAVLLQILFVDMRPRRDLGDGLHPAGLGDLNVRQISHVQSPFRK